MSSFASASTCIAHTFFSPSLAATAQACELQDPDSHHPGPSEATFHRLRRCLSDAGIPDVALVPRDHSHTSHSHGRPLYHYKDLNFQPNFVCGHRSPWAYFVAHTERDVVAAVRCAAQVHLRIVARSGGHSYLAFSQGDRDTLIIDLGEMNSVHVDEEEQSARIGPGARVGQVEYALWSQTAQEHRDGGTHGLVVGLGICPSVGVAGFSLGGGYGFYTRLMGLGSDNILEVRMVTANGTVLTVNAHKNPDLYWAIRGGGGGNFGIVTSFKFRAHRAPKWIALADVTWPVEEFPAFFKAWQAFMASDPPKHLSTILDMNGDRLLMKLSSMRQHDGRGGGGDGGDTVRELQKILATQFPPPTNLTLHKFTNIEFMMNAAQFYSPDVPIVDPVQLTNFSWYSVGYKRVKSMYVTKVLDSDRVLELYELMRDVLFASGARWAVEHYGGAIDDLRPDETAFVHRGRSRALYNVQLIADWKNEPPKPEAVRGMDGFFDDTKSLLGHTQSYQNYLDDTLEPVEYLRRYYGPNLERVVEVKRSVDPRNVFHNPMSIPVHL